MKTVAAAMGADVSDSSGPRSSSDSQEYNITGGNDLGFLPINVGYETIESNG
jgi:hypothetical protein